MSEKRTRRRFERRAKGLPYGATELGSKVLSYNWVALSDYMRSPDAPKPPTGLETIVRQLDPDDLAFAALGPLLHQIDSGWDWKDPSARMQIHLAVGKALRDRAELRDLLMDDKKAHDRIRNAANKHRAFAREHKHHPAWKYRVLNWQESDCCRAGIWLVDCAMALDFFEPDEKGFPQIAEEHKAAIDQLREELTYRDPIFLPSFKPPKPWTGWRNRLNDGERISATFVRNCPSAEKAITTAFKRREQALRGNGSVLHEFRHVDAVNALQAVPWKINERMVPVVRRFAGIEDVDGKQVGKGIDGKVVGKRVNGGRVRHDVATAKWLAKHGQFWLPHNCDFRGRIFAIPDFNFQREDHVRALFLFANGKPIGASEETNPRFAATRASLDLLKVHVANMAGIKGDHLPRIGWVNERRDLIERVAQDPIGTIAEWQHFPEPFSFVAGCMELAGAWKEGASFDTHLPVLSDATCSGVQHLSALAGDEETGRRVNLANSDTRQDLYQDITNRVIAELATIKDTNECAAWWLADARVNRGLLKRPISTFGYSATIRGMRDQIVEAYRDKHDLAEPRDKCANLLAKIVMTEAKRAMPKCAEVMKFIRGLAKYRFDKGLPLKWRSPLGFPVSSAEFKPNVVVVDSPLRGERVRYRIADGYKQELNKRGCLDAAAPNFVHSMDAAHMVATINDLVTKEITDVVGVHDCWGSLATDALVTHRTIRAQFDMLYKSDWLRVLCRHAESDIVPPDRGSLDWFDPQSSEYATT
jgi:DNA-directed RNA polymerase